MPTPSVSIDCVPASGPGTCSETRDAALSESRWVPVDYDRPNVVRSYVPARPGQPLASFVATTADAE